MIDVTHEIALANCGGALNKSIRVSVEKVIDDHSKGLCDQEAILEVLQMCAKPGNKRYQEFKRFRDLFKEGKSEDQMANDLCITRGKVQRRIYLMKKASKDTQLKWVSNQMTESELVDDCVQYLNAKWEKERAHFKHTWEDKMKVLSEVLKDKGEVKRVNGHIIFIKDDMEILIDIN